MQGLVQVLVQAPAHSGINGALSYFCEQALAHGTLVRVPLGKRETLGVVWNKASSNETGSLDVKKLKPVTAVLDCIPPLSDHWQQLVNFSAAYYQRSAGEIALAALPPQLRELSEQQLMRRLLRHPNKPSEADDDDNRDLPRTLTNQQAEALTIIGSEAGPFLLIGTTGSGKTEVYLQSASQLLAREPQAQILVLVPEINLTPQLEARFTARFGTSAVACLHSGLTPAQRMKNWLAGHLGQARIMLGTRMAIFASLPNLRLIMVDEEHDASYKQQEGARYSARDLAVYRGHIEGAKVILGSATPSLESWHHSRSAAQGGRYRRLSMPDRIGTGGSLPTVRLVDMNHQPKDAVFSPPLLAAIKARVARHEQCLILLNRRGYAPVLRCSECDWKSECSYCTGYRVFHKIDRTLRCHHCGQTDRVPRTCPTCGSPDIRPLGRGTEKLEETLGELLASVQRPDGSPVRIARIDADTTRRKGTLATQMAQMHAGAVDILIGTQMIAKGHDFRQVSLVAAINSDAALFSSDFRAPERLFSLLMQAAGRSGRDASISQQSEMWVQTFYPVHPIFEALKAHDFDAFARLQLKERSQAGLPPFSFQALVRSEARDQASAQAFLLAASVRAKESAKVLGVTIYPAVPMTPQRVANVERAQMLIECLSRMALQRFLADWQEVLRAVRQSPEGKGLIRWAVDVDPLAI